VLICANAGVLDRRRSQLGPVAVLNWDKSVQVQTSRTVHAAGLMHLTASLSPQISKVGGTVKKIHDHCELWYRNARRPCALFRKLKFRNLKMEDGVISQHVSNCSIDRYGSSHDESVTHITPNKLYCASPYYLWPLCVADSDIMLLSCFFLSFFLLLFPSPNLSVRRLDVYHTMVDILPHGVALVRI